MKVYRDRITEYADFADKLEGDDTKVFTDLAEQVYHNGGKDGHISRSMLVEYINSPYDYAAYFVNKTAEKKVTNAMKRGGLSHDAILQPWNIEEHYVVIPEKLLSGKNMSISSQDAKDFVAEHEELGKTVIKQKDLDQVQATAAAVKQFVPELATASRSKAYKVENTMLWTCGLTDLKLKVRTDILINKKDHVMVVDVKDTSYFTDHKVRSMFEDRKLVFQQAHYSYGVETVLDKPVKFYFLLLQNDRIPKARLVRINDAVAMDARQEYFKQLAALKSSIINNNFQDDWDSSILEVSPREWSYKKEANV
jgi:hypothetical protein